MSRCNSFAVFQSTEALAPFASGHTGELFSAEEKSDFSCLARKVGQNSVKFSCRNQ